MEEKEFSSNDEIFSNSHNINGLKALLNESFGKIKSLHYSHIFKESKYR